MLRGSRDRSHHRPIAPLNSTPSEPHRPKVCLGNSLHTPTSGFATSIEAILDVQPSDDERSPGDLGTLAYVSRLEWPLQPSAILEMCN